LYWYDPKRNSSKKVLVDAHNTKFHLIMPGTFGDENLRKQTRSLHYAIFAKRA
jgi:hypothetical protein